jgi:hypothetical protein
MSPDWLSVLQPDRTGKFTDVDEDSDGGSDAHTFALCGGVPGALVTAAFWTLPSGGIDWRVGGPLVSGFVVGAVLGVVVGDGVMKEEWAGRFGATVIPTVVVGFLNFVVFVVVAASLA